MGDLISINKRPKSITCKQCGGTMSKGKQADKNYALQVLGVLIFIIGVALLFVIPIGTIAGGNV